MTLATRLACMRWLRPRSPMLRSPAGTASTFTTSGVRSRRSGWETRTAIRPPTVDPDWQPLINTPNFPEYPSGHAAISGAISHVLRLFFGSDELNFQMTTTNPMALQKTRTFTRLSQAEQEVIDARVYVGIHYRNSDTHRASAGPPCRELGL